MGLKIPITADDPWPLEGFDVDGSLFENVHVGLGQPLSIFKINAEDENATFADAPNP